MSNTFRLTGQNGGQSGGALNQILRAAFLVVSAIGGLVMLFFSAAFVLILLAGAAIIGLVVVAVFWARAKILGKPFGPRAHMEKMRREMEQGMGPQFETMRSDHKAPNSGADIQNDGPIIDAHQTPEGWSVDS